MLQKTLNEMGYQSFRPGQKEIINSVMQAKDTFAMLPTGSGKTLCYHLPAKILPGLVLIVSPLVSLMSDQVTQMRAQGEKKVNLLTSHQSSAEKKDILRNIFYWDMLFVSPEMLSLPRIQEQLKRVSVDLFVVDEAHCISQWGHEFRPEYQRLGNFAELLGHPPLLALTATATREVEEDIKQQLGMKEPAVFKTSVNRENIYLSVIKAESAQHKNEILEENISNVPKPCIIYAGTRKDTEEIAAVLGKYKTAFYHGGMTGEDRTLVQAQFLYSEIDILVATNAFGMGINKPDIRTVIHTHMPASLEQYTQEIGRAGRDGQQSAAILLSAKGDNMLPFHFISMEFPAEKWLEEKLYPEIRHECNVTDTQVKLEVSEGIWRMILSHLKEYSLIKDDNFVHRSNTLEILELLEERYKKRKSKKIEQFRSVEYFASSQGCYRRKLLDYFEEFSQMQQGSPCCSTCHPEFYWKDEKKSISISNRSWQERLNNILHPVAEVNQ
ncbi:RecQ family ATP-dependent DNA helicase [Alkalicoccus daliensis]|uniref:ATP-dependent DNA helicase RecQ n=1 Tax=Alkalicoccus daliensis TaxID=745820 RepID=A0A1H0AXC6_9BACI|nr:ATP-dependent DNA helicase RecQ [Alkalicoccus daliensis]SDN38134.1 ATP-dependent DNA helicase RecQ [Alkalicoccus daliensis]